MRKISWFMIVFCLLTLSFLIDGIYGAKAAKPVPNPTAPANKRLTTAPADSLFPSAAWSGSNYGVAYSDSRDGGEPAIYFSRISAKGAKAGVDLKLSNSLNISYNPNIVWNGTEFGVVWSDYSRYDADNDANGCSLYFTRVNSSGVQLGGNIQTTWDNYGICPSNPNLVWNGTGYGVFWQENRLGTGTSRVYMASLDSTGIKTSGDIQLTDFYSAYRRAVWNGTDYVLLLVDANNSLPQSTYLARYDTAGIIIGTEQVVLPSNPAVGMLGADFAWDGAGYGILFLGSVDNVRQQYFMRVGADGTVLIAGTQITNNLLTNGGLLPEKIVWGNNGYALTMGADSYVYFMEVNLNGTIKSQAKRIDTTTVQARHPVPVWANGKYAVLWDDSRHIHEDLTGNVEIYYAIFQSSRK